MEIIIATLRRTNFISISNGDYRYYGGHQAWYKNNPIGVQGGCGPTAAANMLAYLGTKEPSFKNLYPYKKEKITRDDFAKYMEDIYAYIRPIKVPEALAGRKIGTAQIPITLGIPTVGKLKRGAKEFAKSQGLKVHPVRFSKLPTLKNARAYIKEALEKDAPIGLKILLNPKLRKIQFTDATGHKSFQDFQFHWVTITSMSENKDTGEIFVEVSSWGGRGQLNLKDLVRSLIFGGMIYFRPM